MSCYARKFEFYPGEDKTLSLQLNLYERDRDCKEPYNVGVSGDTLEVVIDLPGNPANLILNTTTTPPVVVDDAKLGKIHVDLTSAQTMVISSGTVKVTATRNGKKTIFVATAVVQRLTINNC